MQKICKKIRRIRKKIRNTHLDYAESWHVCILRIMCMYALPTLLMLAVLILDWSVQIHHDPYGTDAGHHFKSFYWVGARYVLSKHSLWSLIRKGDSWTCKAESECQDAAILPMNRCLLSSSQTCCEAVTEKQVGSLKPGRSNSLWLCSSDSETQWFLDLPMPAGAGRRQLNLELLCQSSCQLPCQGWDRASKFLYTTARTHQVKSSDPFSPPWPWGRARGGDLKG